ncbi:MAG: 3-oxoacyl-ACP reductase [Myxococcales bacterium]|nr:3-oxoacyl-ACP reductase [Myxococcales bacterium]
MNDILLEIAKNPRARDLVKSLGLPLPIPEPLKRLKSPAPARLLDGKNVAFHASGHAVLNQVVARTLATEGANPFLAGDGGAFEHFAGVGEAFGRRPQRLPEPAGESPDAKPEGPPLRLDAVVLDATGFRQTADLRALYDVFHPLMGSLAKCGRLIVLGRTLDDPELSVPAMATQGALDGFIRSAAKEIGKRGATALLIRIDPGAEARLPGTLTFALSAASAYVTGQILTVSATAAELPSTGRRLDGKVALVTGAARGIGESTARILAAEGASVVVLDRPDDDGPTSKLAREIGGFPLLEDITSDGAGARIEAAIRARYGRLDIVVHNAGITRDKTLARMRPDHWDSAIAVNLSAVLDTTEHLLASGLIADGGRIIGLSSIAGIAGNMGQTNYAASKSAIVRFVAALAPRVASRGITVNAIAPGFIETRLTAAIPIAIREVARRMNSLGQGGQPEDIGQAVAFFASAASQGVTGQTLRVCGGSLVGA